MKKNFESFVEYTAKNYQKKYEFVSQSEIDSSTSLYSDKQKYRYAMRVSLIEPIQYNKINTNTGQTSSTNFQPVFLFYIYDRLNDKKYATLGSFSTVMVAFKSSLKKLNSVK